MYLIACFGILTSASTLAPWSVPVTADWDGADGKWSTFAVQVGTPPQTLRLLPATSKNAIMPVVPEGCTPQDPANCATLRGYTFMPNASSTWDYIGLYAIGLDEEKQFGFDAGAEFGYETFKLGYSTSDIVPINRSIVQGFAAKDFFLGSIGLDPNAINLTGVDNGHIAPLAALRQSNSIPSTSWSYTAGSPYSNPPIFGSLVLGGYDETRIVPGSQLSINFGADPISRPFVVGIQSITTGASSAPTTLLPVPEYAFIDSLIPSMYLPQSACQAFAQAFNLTWNSTAKRYIVSDDAHNQLVATSPKVTLTLGADLTGQSTQIVLPYTAFDLQLTSPLANPPMRYFPLQPANDSTGYSLGRVVLQEMMLIADYERQNFTIAQADHPPTSVSPKIVTIDPRSQSSNNTSPSSNASSGNTSLSVGAKAGVGAGVAIGAILIIGLTIICCCRRKSKQVSRGDSSPRQIDDESIADVESMPANNEKPAVYVKSSELQEQQLYEKPGCDTRRLQASELSGSLGRPAEMGVGKQRRAELDDGRRWAAELSAEPH